MRSLIGLYIGIDSMYRLSQFLPRGGLLRRPHRSITIWIPTRKCVYLVTPCTRVFWLLWPWPDYLHIQTWPRCLKRYIRAYQNEVSMSRLSTKSPNRTDRRDRTHYHAAFAGGNYRYETVRDMPKKKPKRQTGVWLSRARILRPLSLTSAFVLIDGRHGGLSSGRPRIHNRRQCSCAAAGTTVVARIVCHGAACARQVEQQARDTAGSVCRGWCRYYLATWWNCIVRRALPALCLLLLVLVMTKRMMLGFQLRLTEKPLSLGLVVEGQRRVRVMSPWVVHRTRGLRNTEPATTRGSVRMRSVDQSATAVDEVMGSWRAGRWVVVTCGGSGSVWPGQRRQWVLDRQ